MKSSIRSLVSIFLFVGLIVSSFGLAFASEPSTPSEAVSGSAAPLAQVAEPGSVSAGPVVNVAHLAPFADSSEGTSVTVKVDGSEAIPDFKYGDIKTGVSLSAGQHLLEIVPTGTTTVAISATVNLADDTVYSVAAIGDGVNQDLELLALVDETTPPAAGNGKLRIAHMAPFSDNGTAVDICTDDNTVVVPNVSYKEFTDPYLVLPAGDYNLKIALAGTSCATVALDLPSVSLEDGDIIDVFAIGGANTWPLAVTSITGFDLTPVVNVAHFAPFADTALGTSVTVKVDGAAAIPNFEFGDIQKKVPLPAGPHLIEIVPTGTTTVAISGTVTLNENVQYTAAAIGDGTNQLLELLPLVDDITPAAGKGKVRIAHLAPFASTGTEVDICTDGGTVVLGDVAYKDYTDPYVELPAGVYDLKIALAGTNCETVALDLPGFYLGKGEIVDVFAIGGANDWPLDFTSITGLQVALFFPIMWK